MKSRRATVWRSKGRKQRNRSVYKIARAYAIAVKGTLMSYCCFNDRRLSVCNQRDYNRRRVSSPAFRSLRIRRVNAREFFEQARSFLAMKQGTEVMKLPGQNCLRDEWECGGHIDTRQARPGRSRDREAI